MAYVAPIGLTQCRNPTAQENLLVERLSGSTHPACALAQQAQLRHARDAHPTSRTYRLQP